MSPPAVPVETASEPHSPLPLNRIVAFAGPLIAVIAGALANWLFVHLHFLGEFHTQGEVGTWIGDVIVWGVTSVLVWAGMNKWLTGWQRFESYLDVTAEPAITPVMSAAPEPPGEPPEPPPPPPPPPPAPITPVNPATKLPSTRPPNA